MKTRNIFTILLIGAASLTACNKNNDQSLAPASVSGAGDYSFTAMVNYTLVTQPPAKGTSFQWTSGYINTNELLLNDMHQQQTGNDAPTSFRNERFGAQQIQTISLMNTPVALGGVPMPALTCDMAAFTIQLTPSTTAPSLYLAGTYNGSVNKDGGATAARMAVTPVQIIINGPLDLNSNAIPNVVINSTTYDATLSLDLNQLITGIDATMMSQATATDGVVIISNTSNPIIYSRIMANLAANMQVKFAAEPNGQAVAVMQ
jgi:hypothetical protein